MAKIKLNFYGFHTYPTKPTPGSIAEPLVWIGTAAGYNHSNGMVLPSAAYDTSWYQTLDFFATGTANTTRTIRGNVPGTKSIPTSSYCCGADQLFSRDCYGSAAQAAICYPTTDEESATVFNNAGELIAEAFEWAATYAGVRGAVGVEFPLALPPHCNATLQEAYEGMFGRIVALKLNISTFWLWTNEGVEDHGNGRGLPSSNPMWKNLVAEIKIAQAAAKAVGAPFALGTSGWCLGPGDDAAFFDKEIPDPTFVVSAINGRLGNLPPDPAFAQMNGNRSWAIPWMEDDLSLASAELWVNRTIEHAALAHEYGTSGLLGLMWRTWETSPQITALASAGWATNRPPLSDVAVYTDFCTANFGADTAPECVARFLEVDSYVSPMVTKLPRNGQRCCGGPMGADVVPSASLLNVTGFEQWLENVEGVEYIERATRWVNLFRYHRQTQLVSNASAHVHQAAISHTLPPWTLEQAQNMSLLYTEMVTLLLQITTSPGELGMLGAHEGANWPSVFNASVQALVNRPFDCAVTLSGAECYSDPWKNRTFSHMAWISDPSTTQESCAAACFESDLAYAAVEFGVACFCGAGLPSPSLLLQRSACNAMVCGGNHSESCGGPDIMLVYTYSCSTAPGGITPHEAQTLQPPRVYGGEARMLETAVRTVVSRRSETMFQVEISILSASPPSAVFLHVATLASLPLTNVLDPISKTPHSQVYTGGYPLTSLPDEFEYWTTASFASGNDLRYPLAVNQSVVLV